MYELFRRSFVHKAIFLPRVWYIYGITANFSCSCFLNTEKASKQRKSHVLLVEPKTTTTTTAKQNSGRGNKQIQLVTGMIRLNWERERESIIERLKMQYKCFCYSRFNLITGEMLIEKKTSVERWGWKKPHQTTTIATTRKKEQTKPMTMKAIFN